MIGSLHPRCAPLLFAALVIAGCEDAPSPQPRPAPIPAPSLEDKTREKAEAKTPPTKTPIPLPKPPVKGKIRKSSGSRIQRSPRQRISEEEPGVLSRKAEDPISSPVIVDLDPDNKRPPIYVGEGALNLDSMRDPDEATIESLATYLAADRISPVINAQYEESETIPSESVTKEMLFKARKEEGFELARGFLAVVAYGHRKKLSNPEIHSLLRMTVPALYASVGKKEAITDQWIEDALRADSAQQKR